jgi:hypothetical protein
MGVIGLPHPDSMVRLRDTFSHECADRSTQRSPVSCS